MSSRSILPTGKIQAAVVYPLLFPLLPRERVVILGCGDGPQLAAYAKSGAAMVGVDINADRLNRRTSCKHVRCEIVQYSTRECGADHV